MLMDFMCLEEYAILVLSPVKRAIYLPIIVQLVSPAIYSLLQIHASFHVQLDSSNNKQYANHVRPNVQLAYLTPTTV